MSPNRRATIALIALTLIWGYAWVTTKLALQYAPPFAFSVQRTAIAAAAIFAILLFRRRKLAPTLPWLIVVINGVLQTGLFILLSVLAVLETGAGKTSVLIYTAPIWTLLLAWPLLGERVRPIQWLAAAMALIGLLLIIAPWHLHSSILGNVFGIGSALSWAASTILVKRYAKPGADMMNINAWQLGFGSLFIVLCATAVPERATQWTGEYFGLLAFTSVISTGFGWFLWLYILERLPAWEASLSVLGVPVVAIVSSRLQLGETSSLPEIAGMLLIGAGLVLLSFLNWWREKARNIDAA